ncbi:MAG: Dna2/Cas4 domain-containing protein [Haloferacaceae archaeon]
MPTFSDLARAAYCPRQLYHARRDGDRGVPEHVRERRRLAFRYDALRDAPASELADLPVEPPPPTYRARLDRLAERPEWPGLADPAGRMVDLAGRDCRGVAHKLLAGDPPTPTVVSPGSPPDQGVWEPQRVRAVATALALAWERERSVERAIVEYPAHGVVRTVRLTTGNRAAYREVLRTVRRMDDGAVPARTDDREKCASCAYREACGVRGRSLRSLL